MFFSMQIFHVSHKGSVKLNNYWSFEKKKPKQTTMEMFSVLVTIVYFFIKVIFYSEDHKNCWSLSCCMEF